MPFIFVTCVLGHDFAVNLIRNGATDLVRKNQMEGLRPSIERALREAADRRLRRSAESGRIKAEKEWRATVDAIADLIILADDEGKIARCNQAAVDFFAAPFDHLLGLRARDFLGQNCQSPHPLPNDGVHAEHPRRGVIWEQQIPGKTGWFEITMHTLPDQSVLGEGHVYIIKDITARRQSEETMRQLITAIEQAADSIQITDANGVIRYVNPAFKATTGWSSGEVVGQHFASLRKNSLSLQHYQTMMKTLESGQVWQGIYQSRKKDGSEYDEEATISPGRDGSEAHSFFVSVSRDVTEKRRFSAIAEAVNMTENVGYVFSGIRYERGNPTNSIKTALSVLKKNLPTWTQAQVLIYVDRALTEISRVEYLLQSLKTFSMHEPPSIQPLAVIPF